MRDQRRWWTLARLANHISGGLRTLATVTVDVILIVTFGVQVVRVDGFSMAPALENQDRLVVDKLEPIS